MVEAFIIDEVTEELSASEKALEHTLDLMNQEQPVLLAYLFSENFEVFTEREREFLLFLSCVIWKSVFRTYGSQATVTETHLSVAEDHNWGLLEDNTARQFRERMTVFFDVILGLTQNLSPVRKYYLSEFVEKKEILLFKYSIENNL